MDTHVATHPDIEPSTAEMSARLPGEMDDATPNLGEIGPGERLPSSTRNGKRRRRGPLLASVGLVALAVAGGVFLLSPYNKVYPLPRLQASVNNAANKAAHYAQATFPPILAPSASLAKITVPPTPPAVRDSYTPKPRDQQVAELLSLHPHASDGVALEPGVSGHAEKEPADRVAVRPAPAAATAANPGVPSGYVPREPGSSPAPAAVAASPVQSRPQDTTAAIIASLPKAPPAGADPQSAQAASPATVASTSATPDVAPVAAPVPAPAPDAVAVATSFRAASMTPPEQVQVLNLVTEMAAMVKDLRKQQIQLRADLAKSSADVTAHLTDYERRLALAEARSAMSAADDTTGNIPAKPVDTVSDPAVAPLKAMPVMVTRPVAVVPSALIPPAPKVYRVQAASPGLALLAQVDRGGGDGAQMQVVVGDNVPDYGRVKSIAQKGTAWVVTTEHGSIQ